MESQGLQSPRSRTMRMTALKIVRIVPEQYRRGHGHGDGSSSLEQAQPRFNYPGGCTRLPPRSALCLANPKPWTWIHFRFHVRSTLIRRAANRRANAKSRRAVAIHAKTSKVGGLHSARSIHGMGAQEESAHYREITRRKSEGSDSITSRTSSRNDSAQLRQRRVSFDNMQENGGPSAPPEKIIRCRNNKCINSAPLSEARKTFKSCHNCTCLYCSRECRRAHWQRHRRTCQYSRASSLCIQVFSSVKKDPATLKHVSLMAKRGHLAHGRGAVKCFFPSPESAEKFINNGFANLGEPTFVRWSDILPSEMGAELYAESMRLCETYNPESRLVLYVAVCIVREVPTAGTTRWERQPVSRCAKIRLDASCRQPSSSAVVSPQGRQLKTASPCNITREMDSPETLVLTSMPDSNGQNTPRRAREISFGNIQRQLRLRGVSLRRHFPQVYNKLCSYVDGSVEKFAPVTIYPRDHSSGRSFMCIIMLDAEPERLQLLPTDSSRVRTVDISIEQE